MTPMVACLQAPAAALLRFSSYTTCWDTTLGDCLGVFHLGDGDRTQLVLDGKALDPAPGDVLPDVLDGDLQLAGDRPVELLDKFR